MVPGKITVDIARFVESKNFSKNPPMEKFWRRKVKWIMEMDSNMLKSL